MFKWILPVLCWGYSNLYSQNTVHLNSSLVCNYLETNDSSKVTLILNESDQYTKKIVNNILQPVGLYSNFEIKEGEIANAMALFDDGKRFIIYNKKFIKKIKNKSRSNYAVSSVLAHEIAHHFLGHTFELSEKRSLLELQADFWSGFILYKLGATLKESQEVVQREAPPFSTISYPDKDSRLLAIKEGWENAKKQNVLIGKSGVIRINNNLLSKRHRTENPEAIFARLDSISSSKPSYELDEINEPLANSNSSPVDSPNGMEGWDNIVEGIHNSNKDKNKANCHCLPTKS